MQTNSIVQGIEDLPEWMKYLADGIIENLTKKEAIQFSTDLLDTIPIGAEVKSVEKVRHICAIARLNRLLKLLEAGKAPHVEECRAAIQDVIAYYEAALTDTATEEMRKKAHKKAVEAWQSATKAATGAATGAAIAARVVARAAMAEAAEAARTTAYRAERDILLAALRVVEV